ncbi:MULTISPECIES: DUF2225 domain-containing protein [Exiguobacterium]|uniref:DUF2225 domain-containing protein n=1 Tax=Exiguobacterium TaxID=33986 RepID=UPI001BE7CAD1|nr:MULTISPECIES: DUF2225 domain-containing protein [Exiguobacterium]MCT4775745.1 DUF2225 domain-containing protein [Exiguobacterium aquaticum]MCT4787803.1 DUF2225 domain-containing protein [Exiguobacterium mexicanum]
MAEHIFSKKVKCPYCLKQSETPRVLSRHIRPQDVAKDGYTTYDGANPYFYEPTVCSHCQLVFHDSFDKVRKNNREALESGYFDRVNAEALTGDRSAEHVIRLYKFAVMTAQLSGQKPSVVAMLGMRLVWMYRLTGDEASEKEWMKRTLDKYNEVQEAYTDQVRTGLPYDQLMLRIADLSAALGLYEDARRWYGILLGSKEVSERIRTQARSHWEDFRIEHV